MRSFWHWEATPRVYLFFLGIVVTLLASAVSGTAFVLNSGPFYLAGMALWIVWFALLWLVALPQTDTWLRRRCWGLRPTAIVIFVFLLLFGVLELVGAALGGMGVEGSGVLGPNTSDLIRALARGYGYNDSTALTHQAAQHLLEGENPYAAANVVEANLEFNNPYDRTTPLRVGSFADAFPYPTTAELEAVWAEAVQHPEAPPPEIESGLNYPAGCFLLPVPLLLLGVHDLRWVFLIYSVPAVLAVVWLAPRHLRLWLLGGFLGSLQIWNSMASGETGTLFFPFLLLAWVLWRRNLWLSAIMMGIAISIKQIPWFFLPFYLILMLHTFGVKRAAGVLGITAGVFLTMNLPFIVMDARLWVSSLAAPMMSKMFPLGVGLVSLVDSGFWHTQSSLIFSLLELGVGVAGVVWYYFNCRRYPYTGLILAVLPPFVAWRSLWSYFFYFDVILLACVIVEEYGAKKEAPEAVLAEGETLPL